MMGTVTVWPHYKVFEEVKSATGMAFLREMFPNAQANDLNFVLFSTSGVHGNYVTIEEIEESLTKYGIDPQFMRNDSDAEIPDDYHSPNLTVLIVHPRICCLRCGTANVTMEDIPYLKKLRQSSWEAVQKIGIRDLTPATSKSATADEM